MVFVADAHASVDDKDRSSAWGRATEQRIKALLGSQAGLPAAFRTDRLVWVGDLIDFVPQEWKIVEQWVRWVSSEHPATSQHAVMGNHDYLYYDYPEVLSRFNTIGAKRFRSTESRSDVSRAVAPGDSRVALTAVEGFLVDADVLLIPNDDGINSGRTYLGIVTDVDPVTKTIGVTPPIDKPFAARSTQARQGFSEAHGIEQFLKTFEGTATTATRQVFTEANTAFILVSMDSYFAFDAPDRRTKGLSSSDLDWLDRMLAQYAPTHNLVVVTHELPQSGQSLDAIFDPGDSIDFNETTRQALLGLAARYRVTAWVSGHQHPDARRDKVHSMVNGTHFFAVPSIGVNAEGQALTLKLTAGDPTLEFDYWSIDRSEVIQRIRVTAPRAN